MPKRFLAVAVLWAASFLPAHAAKVKFGETVVSIPAPAGFIQNTEKELQEMRALVADGALDSAKLAFYKEFDAPTPNQPLPLRGAVVFSLNGADTAGIDLETFAKLVASPESKETMDVLKGHLPAIAGPVPVIGAPPGSQERRPLPSQIFHPHVASDRHLAFSMKMTGKTIGPGAIPVDQKTSFSIALVVVRGMVIKLTVLSQTDGVAWTQETCRAWAEAVIAENPAEPGSAGSFSLDTASEALDGLVASLPLEPVIAKARTVPWLGSLSPTALNVVLGVAALAIVIFAISLILKFLRRIRG